MLIQLLVVHSSPLPLTFFFRDEDEFSIAALPERSPQPPGKVCLLLVVGFGKGASFPIWFFVHFYSAFAFSMASLI
uniref:Uncharacterized protein n=1 Tax=Noccaea caerulescens TaxID=107243 RepID=A0A1J3F977_NOCCA